MFLASLIDLHLVNLSLNDLDFLICGFSTQLYIFRAVLYLLNLLGHQVYLSFSLKHTVLNLLHGDLSFALYSKLRLYPLFDLLNVSLNLFFLFVELDIFLPHLCVIGLDLCKL